MESDSRVGRRIDRLTGNGIRIVAAASGAGKSRLVAEWAERERQEGHPVLWYDLRRDPPETVDAALACSVPGARIVLDSVDADDPQHRRSLGTTARLYREGRAATVVVATRRLASELSDLFPTTPRHRVLTTEDLLLSLDEIRSAARIAGIGPHESLLRLVRDLTGGLPRAIEIVLATATTIYGDRGPIDADAARPALAAALNESLLKQAQPTTIALAAHANVWDRQMVAALLPDADPDEVIRTAENDGWIEHAKGPAELFRVITVAGVAARSLPRHARELLPGSPDRLLDLLTCQDRLDEAVDVALLADDPRLLGRLAHQAAVVTRLDLLGVIARALSAKPISWFGAEYDLYLSSSLFERGGSTRYRSWSPRTRLADGMRPPVRTPETRLTTYANSIVLHRVNGRLNESVQDARHALSVFRTLKARGHAPNGLAFLAIDSACVTHTLAGDGASALEAGSEAMAIASDIGSASAGSMARTNLAFAHSIRGDQLAARRLLSDRIDSEHADMSGLVLRPALTECMVQIEAGALHRAREILDAELPHAAETEHWWLVHGIRALLAAASSVPDTERAFDALIRQELQRGRIVAAPRLLADIRATLSVLDQRYAHAIAITGEHLASEHGGSMLRAAAELALGNDAVALKLSTTPVDDSAPRHAILAHLVAAVAAERLGHVPIASHHLQEAIAVMEATACRFPLRLLTERAHDSLFATAQALGTPFQDRLAVWAVISPPRPQPADRPPLTARERELLIAMNGPDTLVQITKQMGISYNTAKTLTARLYRKLGARTRLDAIDAALKAGILDES